MIWNELTQSALQYGAFIIVLIILIKAIKDIQNGKSN